jgi:hypothetical protein
MSGCGGVVSFMLLSFISWGCFTSFAMTEFGLCWLSFREIASLAIAWLPRNDGGLYNSKYTTLIIFIELIFSDFQKNFQKING